MANTYKLTGRGPQRITDIESEIYRLKKPAVSIREYAGSLSTAKAAIGSNEKNLVIDKDLSCDELILGSKTILEIPQGYKITISTGNTLTIESPNHIKAGRYQIFDGYGTVEFKNGGIVFPEWWQENTSPGTTDITKGINYAISAFPTGVYGQISYGPEEYYSNSQIDFNARISFCGIGSEKRSQLTFGPSGKLYFENSDSTRYGLVKDLYIYTADTSIDLIHIDSGYEIKFIRCRIAGGGKAIRIDEAVDILFGDCKISNDAAARYALHCDSGTFVNGLKIKNTRIAGMVFVDLGPSGHGLVIDGSILEAGNDPVCNVNRATDIKVSGNYFEGNNSAESCLDIDQNVLGGSITANFFGVDTDTEVHVLCDGAAIDIRGNYFGTIGSQDQITLK